MRLERRPSPVHGHGVFATAAIETGERIQVVGGLVFTKADRPRLREHLDPGIEYNEGQLGDDLWVLNPVDEGLNYFFNHFCDPYSTSEVTRRPIATGEEVTMDDAIEMTGDYELAPCRCRTALCRDRVTGSDWQRPELQERHGDEFPPFLRRPMS